MAEETPKTHHEAASNADLMASAKIVAEAAQSSFGKDGAAIDKAKVAEAAEDILEAGKSYGKLDETSGVGQYVDKAEGYLHSYHSSNSSSTADKADKVEEKKEDEKEEEEKSGGGAADVINMAKKGLGGFFS
ncbi:nodulin-related protein 1-like [Silene latifolia]|uniref:nodulin-related protein 1-like n=1 Tax=Silene latifolia TaxID=37657 RepID=UPI003D788E28